VSVQAQILTLMSDLQTSRQRRQELCARNVLSLIVDLSGLGGALFDLRAFCGAQISRVTSTPWPPLPRAGPQIFFRMR